MYYLNELKYPKTEEQ